MSTITVKRADARRIWVRKGFRLHINKQGTWTLDNMYDSYEEAFEAGLQYATGQTEEALEALPERDFRVVQEWTIKGSP